MPYRICCVCTGNICRSPIAQVVLSSIGTSLGADLEVSSAGTGSWHVGQDADPRARAALLRHGYQLSEHHPRQIHKTDLNRFDLILALDFSNLASLFRLWPEQPSKVAMFVGFGQSSNKAVPDPYYGDAGDFDQVVELCEEAAPFIVRHLSQLT